LLLALQGKLEAMPLAEAVSVLEAAWSTAYKVIGSGSADVRTIDMITGAWTSSAVAVVQPRSNRGVV
jgi:hypothetical protein